MTITNNSSNNIVDDEIDKLIEMGIIIPMETPYLHNLILVRKSNDEYRPCLDMRPTNAVTVVDSYPVGNMHEILSDLYGNTLFSSLDIRQAYYQISIPKINQVRFGLYTDRGTYVYTRLPFGYVNSGQIIQRYLDRVLGLGHLRCFARAYYDDIIIKTHSGLEDHLIKVGEVMEALSKKRLSLNIQKCQIAHDSPEFLGQLITPQGIQPAYGNKQTIKNLRVERSITGIKRFLGCIGFFNYIIPNYSKMCGPLTFPLSKRNKDGKWSWTSEQDDAVDKLKKILLSDERVVHPQFDKPFYVYVDSSELYHGAVICQEDSHGKLKVVRYWSKKRTHSKKLRSSVYIELQGIVEVVRKFRNYFIGIDVTIFTDNRGLISIIRESTEIHFSQWIYELMNYRLTIKYVPGPKNQLADMLFRTCNVEEEKKPVNPEIEEEKYINIDDSENTYRLNSIIINELKSAQEIDKNITENLIKEYNMIKLNKIWGIYVSRENGINSIFVPYLPDYKVEEICRQTHELGHFCINKCRNLLKIRWFNPNIERTLKRLIIGCVQCQKCNQHYPRLTKHQYVDYDEPRACYSMDLCGPIGGKNMDKNRYILLMVDCFS
uniref:RNA-directed DNA polymerase n=1 Tax=Strongyloides venezuelensis TaxID=75913 RepID=A0A0K0FFF9_STRVS